MTDNPQIPGLIPDQLLSNIRKGDCVLFLGADLPLGYEGAPLSRPELAAALAGKYDLPRDRPWPETAQAYLGRYPNDRHGLIQFLVDRMTGPAVRPGPLHEAIARAGFGAIVSSWYDDLLERALRDAGCRVHWVVRDTQIPFTREGEREVIVVKLYGCLSDVESLILTPWDHNRLIARLNQKLKFVTSFCSIRPLLFVGHDLCDTTLMQLYVHAAEGIESFMHRTYAVWKDPTEEMRVAWQGRNLQLIDRQPAPFLEALAAQMPAVEPAAAPIRAHKPPYKFLDFFAEADADIFCGRDTESQLVFRLALSGRVLTLFGPSGAGKTSLLLAGVLPRLKHEGYVPLYLRALDAPLPALRRAVAARTGQNDPADVSGQGLRDFLAAHLRTDDRLVIVFDQFEELFLRVGSRVREEFFEQLAGAVADAERDVRFLFSLREDYLAHLDEARPHLPEVFANSYRLQPLDRGNARLAITEPAGRAGVAVEPILVDALVGREGAEAGTVGDLVEADGTVPPPALQIVMDRLYRAALPPHHDPEAPPPPGLALTLDCYRDLGDAGAILAAYVDDGLALLPTHGGDAALGEAMLKVMVTSQKTKAALTHAELLAGLDETGVLDPADEADRRLAERTRLGLERVRLLRGFRREGQALYELAHDHLAAGIARRISEEEMQAKMARELLRRQMDNWRGAGLLIPPEALALIHEQRDDLRRLDAGELELLLRSTLAAGYEGATSGVAHYWFERARRGGVAADRIALEGLKSDNFRIRAAAVAALGQLGEPFAEAIVEMLADDYPQVRVAAIHALERLRPGGEWRAHLKYECYVPAGEFIMGEDKEAHRVHLDAFYIGKYPVTNADYQRYMVDIRRAFEIPQGKANHPVVEVSWYDARDYAAWAGLRLVTEAEWEKAASWDEEGRVGLLGEKKGRKRQYPWGYTSDKNRCNTDESGIGGTTPVGGYSPQGDSPYGCADMAGNVWEWTSSLYKAYPYQAGDGREDASDSGSRVVRGGSWYFSEIGARCAFRSGSAPDGRYVYSGCRVGVSLALPF